MLVVDQENERNCCYFKPGETSCGTCIVCGAPGHIRHYPGPSPYTDAWCDKHYYQLATLNAIRFYFKGIFFVIIFVLSIIAGILKSIIFGIVTVIIILVYLFIENSCIEKIYNYFIRKYESLYFIQHSGRK